MSTQNNETDASALDQPPKTSLLKKVGISLAITATLAVVAGGVVAGGQVIEDTHKIIDDRNSAYETRIASVYGADSAKIETRKDKRVLLVELGDDLFECDLPTSDQVESRLSLNCDSKERLKAVTN